MLVLIAAWRHTQFFQTFSVMTNYALMLLGGLLFLMQMHGYEHTANAEEYAQTKVVPESGQDQRVWRDTKRIVIPPMGDLEYKIYVIKGHTFSFQWQTDGEHVFFDFHGEPEGDNTGYFESFEENTLRQSSGEHTATFSGTHGWYWKNSTGAPVVITLNTQGDYQSADTKFQRPKKPASEPEKAHESMFKLEK